MNGTILNNIENKFEHAAKTLKDEIKFKKSEKRLTNVRFILAIILTNSLVFLLSASTNNQQIKLNNRLLPKKTHENFQLITVPLNVQFEWNQNEAETPITLINEQNETILEKAFLYAEKNTDGKDQKTFMIEIPKNIRTYKAIINVQKLNAIPYFPMPTNLNVTKGSKYEIIF